MGTVLDVQETWKAGGGWQSEDGIKGSTQWVRNFTVTVSNTPTQCYAADVLADIRIPKSGHSHPANPWFRCRSAQATRVSPIMFEVQCTYKSKSKDPNDNPLTEPADIQYSTLQSTEEIDEDIDGNPINTAAGEPITGVKIQVGDLAATVTKNLPSFNPASIYTYANTVNSSTFMGFAAGVVRIHNITAKIVYAEDLTYWTVTVVFHFRYPVHTSADKSWWKRVRHEGTLYLAEDLQYPPLRFTERTGQLVGGKGMLKDNGTKETDPTIGHWKEFQVYRTQNFNSLGLGV
tara:strand:- start:783 stop:1652 length:870 start_codon:yes stop_codon:yes gene_type:complete